MGTRLFPNLVRAIQYGNIGCARIELVVFREGENWKGNGTLVASYRGGLALDCPYSISTLISENAKGELFLSLFLPRQMLSQVYRCPRLEELGGMQWFYLPLPYVKRP